MPDQSPKGIPENGIGGRQPQGKADLEAALDSLTPGKHYLYVATSEDWGNGPKVKYGRNDRPFNPKRQKMELLVP